MNVTSTPRRWRVTRLQAVPRCQCSGEYPRDMRVMYVKPRCPYCQAARDSLAADGVDWEERDATTRPDWRGGLVGVLKGKGVGPTLGHRGQGEAGGGEGRAL